MNRIVTLEEAAYINRERTAYPTNNRPAGLLSGDPGRCSNWMLPVGHPPKGESTVIQPNLRMLLPFGVVIGDSISEGSPLTCGRLKKNGEPVFNPQHVNVPGQLSYEFGAITGMHWYNHGIGGQRTDQVWERWSRDVLGETFDPEDGRGNRTLPGQACAVFVIAGINDVFQNKEDEFIQKHWVRIAQSAREHNIVCVFSDMGEHNQADPPMREQIKRLNRWIREFLPAYGAKVVDFYEWSKDPERGFGVHPHLFVDDVHPSRSGFQSLARHYASQWYGLPLYLEGLILEAVIDRDAPPEGYGRAKRIAVKGIQEDGGAPEQIVEYVLEDKESGFISLRNLGPQQIAELTLLEAYGSAERSGFSNIRAILSDQPIF